MGRSLLVALSRQASGKRRSTIEVGNPVLVCRAAPASHPPAADPPCAMPGPPPLSVVAFSQAQAAPYPPVNQAAAQRGEDPYMCTLDCEAMALARLRIGHRH